MNYTHRYLARVTLEAATALFVGSGEQGLLNDALIQRDHHGLPMIQGTSLAGVLRHNLEDQASDTEKALWNKLFGYQVDKDGLGSQVRISSAYLLLSQRGNVAEGLQTPLSDILQLFETLPLRQHVRINHRGAAKDKGLFNNEVIFKGCQFKFEIELRGNGSEIAHWEAMLNKLNHPLFRIGQGTRNGYGQLSIKDCSYRIFNLKEQEDFDDYLAFDPSLNSSLQGFQKFEFSKSNQLTHYQIKLHPEDTFFIFGSGFADDTADQTPIVERILEYTAQGIKEVEHTLIPASSIKGALSHRTCFHYNRLQKIFADELVESEYPNHVGTNNKAVNTLFGIETEDESGQRGQVIINDISYPLASCKVFNHVAIDRFTGGAMDGALFSERVNYNLAITLDIYLENVPEDEHVLKAFECALHDLYTGYLPLGGMTTKGHGLFAGDLILPPSKNLAYVHA